MLNLGKITSYDCQRMTRRAMMQVGSCSALGIGLPQLLAQQASASSIAPKATSVLLLWLWGGPSHHETWDPKPRAPLKIRGSYNPISTATTGVQISELLPMSAQRSDKFSILRSMAHDQKDHNVAGTVSLTGHTHGAKASGAIPFPGRVRPSMGSIISYLTRNRTGDWPAFTTIGRSCSVSFATLRGQTANSLGAPHDPFRLDGFSFEDGIQVPPSLEPLGDIGSGRLNNRRTLLTELDGLQRSLESSRAVDRYGDFRQRAFGLLTSTGAKQALNLDAEKDQLRDRYGRTVFGQNCLLGRRLIESGVPFVQINWSGNAEDEQQGGDGGWDLHYRLFERMQDRYCPIFDRAFSALLDDLDSRGLLQSTLVLAMGEFGRSPKISGLGGREHWPFGYSLAVAGGGTPGGTVVGATTFDGGFPASRPNHPVDLVMTVLELMGLDRLPLFSKDAALIGTPIPELIG
jgi:hypothetical protein